MPRRARAVAERALAGRDDGCVRVAQRRVEARTVQCGRRVARARGRERAALRKQVDSNGEWIESINAFRRQVNANMVELEADIAALSAPIMQ